VQCYGVAGLTCLTPCPIEGVATYPFIEKPGRTGPFDRLRRKNVLFIPLTNL